MALARYLLPTCHEKCSVTCHTLSFMLNAHVLHSNCPFARDDVNGQTGVMYVCQEPRWQRTNSALTGIWGGSVSAGFLVTGCGISILEFDS